MSHHDDRRVFLKNLAAAAVTLPTSAATWAEHRYSQNPFGLGIASGSPTHSSVVLWTRLFDQGLLSSNLPNENLPVKWEVSSDENFTQIIQSGGSYAVSGLAHSVHVDVLNLPQDRWFYYRFKAGNHTSPTGKTRTFAEPGTAQRTLRAAFASCQNYEQGYFNAYPHVVKESPDLMIFLGDYIYEYAPGKTGIRSHSGSWCLDLNDYRKRYAQYKQEPELQLMHAACPWLVTWDDHEVQNDYAGQQQGSFGPATDFSKRKLSAHQAFYEHMPLRTAALIEGITGLQRGAELRIYEKYAYGNLLGIAVLDARQYRDPQACTPGGKMGSGHIDPKICEALVGEKRSLLGLPQEQWLESQFASSRNQIWNLIAQPTLFGRCEFMTSEGVKIWNDGWDGYPAARSRLTNQLVKYQVPNPVILGGDVHENWVGYIKEDYQSSGSKNIGVEFCGTSISSYDGKNTLARQKRNPHFIYADGTRKGYAMMEISSKELIVHLRCVKDHRAKDTEIETLASFRVLSGSTKLEKL